MNPRIEVTITANRLALSGILDFESVLTVNELGLQWLGNLTDQDCYLDLQSVTYGNSAGIILLLSWLRCAYKDKKNLKIIAIPKNMMDLARISGLDGLFKSVEENES